jgi:hypothetical protein
MHKKCVIIAGKEYINDIRPKQNINKCKTTKIKKSKKINN